MFSCKHCDFYKQELDRIQKMNDDLMKKLMALVDARAFSDVFAPHIEEKKQYYNAFGEPVQVLTDEEAEILNK